MVVAGAVHVTVAVVLPPTTASERGADGGAAGVNTALAAESVPTPNAVIAATFTIIGVPLTSPVTVWPVAADPVLATRTEKLLPPSVEAAMR